MKRDKANIFLPILMFLMFLLLMNVFPVQRVLAQSESCVTSKCHASMGKDKVVHNPVKDGMCTTCHQAVQEPGKNTKHPGNLTISLVQRGADLCSMCHEPKNKKKVVHAPIMGGDCTSCHNPHQSPNKAMLKDVVPKLCFQCHADSMIKHKVMHPPVAAGDCSGCHDNHQSDFPNRLVQEGNALCFTCHPDKEEGVKTRKAVHPPVKQSCVLCHNPHGSANKAMLSSVVPSLCSNCHPNEAGLTQKTLTKHGPMNDPKACLNCHDPHVADYPKMLPVAERELCLGCHDKAMETESGAIKDMKAFLEANKGGQGPLKGKACVTCHNPHGSDYMRLLVKYYAPTFYTSYSDGKYAICFSCHDKKAFTEIKTVVSTGFRNGSKNLHFTHVNKISKGRTCRTCHDECAECKSTGQPKHVKDTVGFSYWQMPLNFTRSATGGSCAPGCHGEKQYLR